MIVTSGRNRTAKTLQRPAGGVWSAPEVVPTGALSDVPDARVGNELVAVPVGTVGVDLFFISGGAVQTMSRRAGVWSAPRALGTTTSDALTAVHHRGRTDVFWNSGRYLTTSSRVDDAPWSAAVELPGTNVDFSRLAAVAGADGQIDVVGLHAKVAVGVVTRAADGTWDKEITFLQNTGDSQDVVAVRHGDRLDVVFAMTPGYQYKLGVVTRQAGTWGTPRLVGKAQDSASVRRGHVSVASRGGPAVEIVSLGSQGIMQVSGSAAGWGPQQQAVPYH